MRVVFFLLHLAILLSISLYAFSDDSNQGPAPACESKAPLRTVFREKEPLILGLKKDPVKTYSELQTKHSASADFIEYFRIVAEKMVVDLSAKLAKKVLTPELKAELIAVRDQASEYLVNAAPYLEFMRFTLRYVKAIDRVVRLEHPRLQSTYNQGLAERYYEELLAKAPDVFIFPSFNDVTPSFFLRSKAVPVYLLGLITEPQWADGYLLTPLEFFMHDLGHTNYMARRDLHQLAQYPADKRIGVLNQWKVTAEALAEEYEKIQASNPDLAAAYDLVLFEILHERGYSYDLATLRQQLETPKWVEVILKKRDSAFFKAHKKLLASNAFTMLGIARLRLLNMVENYILNSLKRFSTNRESLVGASPELAKTLRRVPRLEYLSGFVESVVIHGEEQMDVNYRLEGSNIGSPATLYTTPILESSLAQISAGKERITPALAEKLSYVVHLKTRKVSFKFHGQDFLITKIFMDDSCIIQITATAGSTTKNFYLENFPMRDEIKIEVKPIDPLYIFKINQLIHIKENRWLSSFSLVKPEEVLKGYSYDLDEEKKTVTLLNMDTGDSQTIPASELVLVN